MGGEFAAMGGYFGPMGFTPGFDPSQRLCLLRFQHRGRGHGRQEAVHEEDQNRVQKLKLAA